MLISLYTSRVVLSVLGVNDYGIYNVIGGIAGSFSFLSSMLSNATQRYLNVAIGQNDKKEANHEKVNKYLTCRPAGFFCGFGPKQNKYCK